MAGREKRKAFRWTHPTARSRREIPPSERTWRGRPARSRFCRRSYLPCPSARPTLRGRARLLDSRVTSITKRSKCTITPPT